MVIDCSFFSLSSSSGLKNANYLKIKINLGSRGEIFPPCLSEDPAPPCLRVGNYRLPNHVICQPIYTDSKQDASCGGSLRKKL